MRRGIGLLPRIPGDRRPRPERTGREGGQARERFLLLHVAGERLAIAMVFLREVAVPEGLAVQPGSSAHDVGVFLHRGGTIPVVHLARLLGLEEEPGRAGERVVVGEVGGRRFGLLADGVGEVVEAAPEAILPLPDGATRVPSTCFRGIWCGGDRAVLLLNEAGLAALEGVERFGEAVRAPAPVPGRGTT